MIIENKTVPVRVGSQSLLGISDREPRPLSFGNYFSLTIEGIEIRVLNMWVENLKHAVRQFMRPTEVRVRLYHTDDGNHSWCLIDDSRILPSYYLKKLYLTGCRRPPLDIAQDMYWFMGGDPDNELELWTDPLAYHNRRGWDYDPKTGIVSGPRKDHARITQGASDMTDPTIGVVRKLVQAEARKKKIEDIATLHELLKIALDDFEKVAADPRYRINMDYWHRVSSLDGRCEVCLAGSVLAVSLGAAPDQGIGMDDLSGALSDRLGALDHLRLGEVADAFHLFYGREADLGTNLDAAFELEELYGQHQELQWSDQRRLGRSHKKLTAFIATMRNLQSDLQEAGL